MFLKAKGINLPEEQEAEQERASKPHVCVNVYATYHQNFRIAAPTCRTMTLEPSR